MSENVNQAVIIIYYRFILFIVILFTSNAYAISPESKLSHNISISPYTQKLQFKEVQQERNLNNEKGTTNGAVLKFSTVYQPWRFELAVNYSKGSLKYDGMSQLGQDIETKTEIENSYYQLLVARQLYNFQNHSCQYCGLFEGFFSGNFDITKRYILSVGKVSGLDEIYTSPMLELGVIWKLTNELPFNVNIKAWRSQAIGATLDVDFLSRFDQSSIPLNNVYANQIEFSVDYPVSDHFIVSLVLKYKEGKIQQSDKFPLLFQQEVRGEFYQPQRSHQSKTLGLTLNVKY